MKKKISLLLAIVMVFGIMLTGCGDGKSKDGDAGTEDSSLELITKNKKIVLGTDADYPPFEFHILKDGKDEIVGLDIEIAKYIAEELGVELEIREMDFDKLLGGLSTGMLDMVIAGMNPDPDRAANFTDIYYEANLSVLVHKDDAGKISKVEDLDGQSIGVQMGTVQEEIAQDTIKDADVVSLSKNPDLIMNLATKKIEAAILETPVAEAFAKSNDDVMVVEGLFIDNESGGTAIAVKEGNDELTKKLNEILNKIKDEGLIEQWLIEADELSTKYM